MGSLPLREVSDEELRRLIEEASELQAELYESFREILTLRAEDWNRRWT